LTNLHGMFDLINSYIVFQHISGRTRNETRRSPAEPPFAKRDCRSALYL
jgi:hypothetical protein